MLPRAAGEPISLSSLPPLHERKHGVRRKQAAGGIALVLGLVAVFVALTTTVAFAVEGLPRAAWWAILAALYAEALVALGCLARLMLADPGELVRSEELCFPLPPAVARRLAAGESLEGMGNVQDGDDSFCVRCLVWRRAVPRAPAAASCSGGRCLPRSWCAPSL